MTNQEFFQAQIAKCDRSIERLTAEFTALAGNGPTEPCAAYYEHHAKCSEIGDFRRGAKEERQYWTRRLTAVSRLV